LLGDVVDVVGVVEFDIDGPDSPRFGAAYASTAAAMMIVPARKLVAKCLRIMSALRFQVPVRGVPLSVLRMANDLFYEWRTSQVQTSRTPGLADGGQRSVEI
jgi:hypothetical protein